MDEITIWSSPIRRLGDNRPTYMYTEGKNTVYFRTMKDKCEIGFYDKEKGILYLNDDYKTQFKAIKRQIIKDYTPKSTTAYVNLKGLTI